ncbi:putative thioredoxin reductase [Rosellinia necatrix]|uniref:Putative thioredoxin reductase n=1 Tax=Rosellinia necatrix TaxID=77044 RepID=A0A1S8A6Q6_ROSNE|nr:putative thioredoxin reductase [Rosellinia necatrix]
MGLTGSPSHALMLVEDALKFAHTVTVYTNGNTKLADEVRNLLWARGENGVQIDSRTVTRLIKNPGNTGIQTRLDGAEIVVEDFLVHQPDTHADRNIVAQPALHTDGRGDIVSRMPFYVITGLK